MNAKFTPSLSHFVLSKKFKANYERNGYNADQVDAFLDDVIDQVRRLETRLQQETEENSRLRLDCQKGAAEIAALQARVKSLEESGYQLLATKTQTKNPK